jgi:isocitrate dehydrogenase
MAETMTTDARGASGAKAPVIPVLPGDGAGPELWAATRRVLDLAVEKTTAGARRLDWLELRGGDTSDERGDGPMPAATIEQIRKHGVALRGPLTVALERGPGGTAMLRRALDLHVGRVRVRRFEGLVPAADSGETVLYHDLAEGPAGAAELGLTDRATGPVLQRVKGELSRSFGRLRFASRERTESYLRSVGRREASEVELALAWLPVSRAGVSRFAAHVIAEGLEERRGVLVVVNAGRPVAFEKAFQEWVFREADESMPDRVLSWIEYDRVVTRGGQDRADATKAEILAQGGLFLDAIELPELLAGLAQRGGAFPTVVASAQASRLIAAAIAAKAGGPAMASAVSLGTAGGAALFETLHGTVPAHAGKDTANPTGLMLAGAELLAHVGLADAAKRVTDALAKTFRSGKRTAELPGSTPPLGTAAFGEAVAAAL